MSIDSDDFGILILAGGEAMRLPGKLEMNLNGEPLLARTFGGFRPSDGSEAREVIVSCKATFPAALDALLPAPAIVDRWARLGPLGGMLTCFPRMRSRWVFALAGDAPDLDLAFADALAATWQPGDEAIVPVRDDGAETIVEPLAALYDRMAFVRAGMPLLRSGRGSLRLVLDRLRTRRVPFAGDGPFANLNTIPEFEAFERRLTDGS